MGLKKTFLRAQLLLILTFSGSIFAEEFKTVVIKTDMGSITVELFPEKSPATVANFLFYVNKYYYDGVIFHRVVKNYIIQSGGYTYDLFSKEPGDPIPSEASNGLKNSRGTIAMARMPDPDSARAQFFFNLRNNRNLDSKQGKPGYTVFGQVIKGMEVVEAISKVEVEPEDIFEHLPVDPVQILSIREINTND